MQQRGMKALLFGVLLALAGCASDPFADYAPLDGAVQTPHPKTVPQASREGEILPGYDVARSFFPLALSGALVDHSRGIARGYHAALLADFNAVTADPDQPLDAQLAAADGSRLQLLRATPREDWGNLQHAALLDASDIAVVAMPRGPKGLATEGITAFERSLRQYQDRPFWALLPASARTGNGETLPDPEEAQVMAFVALMAGATGLIWHGEDNYAARNAGMLGIAPAPQSDYGIQTGQGLPALKATPADVAASRRLWTTVMQLNRRIAKLVPALLQPDATDPYTFAIATARSSALPPRLRSLLKPAGNDTLLLIVLNEGAQAEDFRIGFSRALRSVSRVDDVAAIAANPERGLFRDTIPARGLRLYRVILIK
jgi:hypothetical protein